MPMNHGYTYQGIVPERAGGKTVQDYLASAFPHDSQDSWCRRIEAGEVTTGGATMCLGQKVRAGQEVSWSRPPWNEPDAPTGFTVLMEDDSVVAVNKPSGLPTLPGGGFLEMTLLHQVRQRFPGAVPMHRLGRGTSGIVLFARTEKARSDIQRCWQAHEVKKVYLAVVDGVLTSPVHVTQPIGPVRHPILGTLNAASDQGKPSDSMVYPLGVIRGWTGPWDTGPACGDGVPNGVLNDVGNDAGSGIRAISGSSVRNVIRNGQESSAMESVPNGAQPSLRDGHRRDVLKSAPNCALNSVGAGDLNCPCPPKGIRSGVQGCPPNGAAGDGSANDAGNTVGVATTADAATGTSGDLPWEGINGAASKSPSPVQPLRTLVEVHIATGRPHQIRIHMAWLGHPLSGDPLFRPGGRPDPLCTALPGDLGYLLHARRLTFPHPVLGRDVTVEAPLPSGWPEDVHWRG